LPKRLVIFVEGKGDVAAVPKLAQLVLAASDAVDALFVDHEPFRVTGIGTLVKNSCRDWHRWLTVAGATRKNLGAVLLVLDGDADKVPSTWKRYVDEHGTNEFCAFRVAKMLGQEARAVRAGEAFSLAVVFSMREFEAWLVASIESLRGVSLAGGRGAVPDDAAFPEGIDIEAKRDAKGVLRQIVPEYKQSLDQGLLAAKVEPTLPSERCRSFRRFVHAIEQLASAVRDDVPMVSP
jgi:hypothetical protein